MPVGAIVPVLLADAYIPALYRNHNCIRSVSGSRSANGAGKSKVSCFFLATSMLETPIFVLVFRYDETL